MSTTESKILLSDLDDDQVRALLDEHGSASALSKVLGMAPSTLKDALKRRGIGNSAPQAKPSRRSRPTLTRADVEAAMQPQNNCRVKAFRDTLDEDAQDALDFALEQDKRDLNASGVREMLIRAGFKDAEVPGVDAINSHRRGERPCRCKG